MDAEQSSSGLDRAALAVDEFSGVVDGAPVALVTAASAPQPVCVIQNYEFCIRDRPKRAENGRSRGSRGPLLGFSGGFCGSP
jgi:hypothetical protein